MRILVIDDEPEILNKITILAESGGYQVKSLSSLTELRQLFVSKGFYPEVIILDRILHGQDSLEVIPQIKRAFADSRLLIVSAIDTGVEKANALDAGADDYLAKPFSAVELMARVKALMRRKSLYESSTTLTLGGLTLNKEERSVQAGDKKDLNLTQKEFQLLFMFCSHPGKIFPKEFLLEKIWQSQGEVESKVVEATINNLRRKLEGLQVSTTIKNMRNVGYWLET